MKITVFTPTYNRGYIIENAYKSLCRQTVKDFEWIVVDDGSTDNTGELFQNWMTIDNGFPIHYKFVENGGKMRAANLGAQLAQGELFLNLDSDDYLTDDAIETVIEWEKTIKDEKDKYAGVAGQKCHFDDSPVGTSFEGDFLDATPAECRKNNISGDKMEVFYTELLKKHPFPEFEGEKFIAEGITWMVICHEEKRVLRWFQKAVYKCEYLQDGYSHKTWELGCKNPQGELYNCLKLIEIMKPSYVGKLRLWHKYFLVAKKNGMKRNKIIRDLKLNAIDYFVLLIGHYCTRLKHIGEHRNQ